LLKGPSPEAWPFAIASAMYWYSLPTRQGRLNGIDQLIIFQTLTIFVFRNRRPEVVVRTTGSIQH
jgi:hypothetical protein